MDDAINLRSPIDLPESESGRFKISHRHYKPGTKLAVVSMRTAYMTGQKPQSAIFEEGLRVHELVQEGQGVWMTDIPQEVVQMRAFAKSARGRVLIGGLGIGVLTHFVAKKKSVTRIDIVENSPDVIKLCGRDLPKKCHAHEADLLEYLKKIRAWRWDRAYFDTWQGTDERTWHNTVLPLKRFVMGKFGPVRIECWAENEMLGQVVSTLSRFVLHPVADHPWKWYNAFRLAAAEHGYPLGVKLPEFATKEFAQRMIQAENDPKLIKLIRLFVMAIGSPKWEQVFGRYEGRYE